MQASWSSKIATKNHTICKEAIYSQTLILSELPLISNNKPINQNSRGWSHELSTILCVLFSTSDCNFRYQKLLLLEKVVNSLQHRLRIWVPESLTKILVPSWKKGLFIFHFISTLEDFVFGFFLNLMRQICCTQKHDLPNMNWGNPMHIYMWWIFHIHVADLIYSKLHMIWFTPTFVFLLETK